MAIRVELDAKHSQNTSETMFLFYM